MPLSGEYEPSTSDWARENAEKELKRLQEAILAKAADEPFFKEVEAK